MGQCSIANGMVTQLLILKDALIMDTGMKMKVRQRQKHAVHAAEEKRGAQCPRPQDLVQLPPPCLLTFARIAMKNSGIR